jgi:hypothetical protein
VQAEEQRQVAVNAFLLQHLGGANAFPRGSDLDEDAVAANACLVVFGNDLCGLRDGGFGVVRQARVDLGGDAAGNDGQNLLAEGDGQALEGQIGHVLVCRAFAEFVAGSFSTPSTMGWYCGSCAAAVISEGLVVASCGRNFSIESISPVSATTTV